jgi:hypothetical protein
MHPRIIELLGHLDRHREALREAVESVPVEARDRRPEPTRWSVAEVLEHLGIVEARVTLLLASRIEAGRAEGLRQESEMTPVLGTLNVEQLLDRSRRLVSGDSSLPSGSIDAAAAWVRLEQERIQLRQVVMAADGLALGELTAPHARLGPLNLYQWLIFLGAHEGRHALQIKEVGEALAAREAARAQDAETS